jgi:hypothetical protein
LKLIEKSQNKSDKEIQSIMGDDCLVCFGKGYKDNELKQVVEDTKTYINDFPELKDNIKMIGDRNNLEKYYNALQDIKEPTEEEIQAKIAQLKKFTTVYGENPEQRYRQMALDRLKAKISLPQRRDALAYWAPSNSAMVYMGKMKSYTEENTQRNFDTNWHSSNKLNGIYCHELGHAVDTTIDREYENLMNKYRTDVASIGLAGGWDEFYKKRNELNTSYTNFRNTINELYKQNYNQEYKTKFNEYFKEKTGQDYNERSYNKEKYEASKYAEERLKQEGVKKYALSEYGNTNIKEFVAESFSAHYTNMNNPLAEKVYNAYKDISNKLKELKK